MNPITHDNVQRLHKEMVNFVDELNKIHKQLADLNQRLEGLEQQAGEMGMDQAKFAFRNAYVKISQAGESMVAGHLILNTIPIVAGFEHKASASAEKTSTGEDE